MAKNKKSIRECVFIYLEVSTILKIPDELESFPVGYKDGSSKSLSSIPSVKKLQITSRTVKQVF